MPGERDIAAASYAQGIGGIRESGGSFRPADGTIFSASSPSADEGRVQALENAILEYVAVRAEPPAKGTTLADYAAEAVTSRVATHLTDLALLASRGDANALEAYAHFAQTMVGALNRLPKAQKRRLRRFASQRLNWPGRTGVRT